MTDFPDRHRLPRSRALPAPPRPLALRAHPRRARGRPHPPRGPAQLPVPPGPRSSAPRATSCSCALRRPGDRSLRSLRRRRAAGSAAASPIGTSCGADPASKPPSLTITRMTAPDVMRLCHEACAATRPSVQPLTSARSRLAASSFPARQALDAIALIPGPRTRRAPYAELVVPRRLRVVGGEGQRQELRPDLLADRPGRPLQRLLHPLGLASPRRSSR